MPILGNNGYDQCSDACDCIGVYNTEKVFYIISGGSTIYQYFYEHYSYGMCVYSGYRKLSAYNRVVEDEPCSVDKFIGSLHTKVIFPDTMSIYVE